MAINTTFAPAELKAVPGSEGEFEGHGAVFGNVDSHGDVILPGAFEATLAEHRARGTMPGLYLEHSATMGGDLLPAGVWLDLKEDAKGLHGRGKISALKTEYGQRIRGLMQDGALSGLSIAFRVRPNGATYGNAPGQPRRTLKAVDLFAVDLVTSPSNPKARVSEIKSLASRAELEDLLIEGGLARGAARKIAGPGWAALSGKPIFKPTDPATALVLKAIERSASDLKSLGDLFK